MQRFGQLGVVLALAVALMAPTLAQDRAREQRLQQAIDLLETRGDVAAAMPLLEEVAKSSDPALAARGLLYLGQAQEKQGRQEARATYARIVQRYAAQRDIVAQARVRLAALRTASIPAGLPDLTIRRIGTSSEVIDSVSPDGTRVTETDWATGNIVVRDVATGRATPVTQQPAGVSANYVEFGEKGVFSPDGTQIAYTWCTANHSTTFRSNCEGYVRIVRLRGGEPDTPRLVYDKARWTYVYDWSPDGQYLAAVVERDRSNAIAVIHTSTGEASVVKALGDWRPPTRIAFSPDGKRLAFDVMQPNRATAARSAILIIGADGTREQTLASDFDRKRIAGWTPDGSRVLFTADRGGTTELFSVPTDGGVTTIVRAEMPGANPLRISRAGSLYYSIQSGGGSQIQTATIDFASGALSSAPRAASQSDRGSNSQPLWFQDGSLMLYVARPSVQPGSRPHIVLRHADGATREVRPDLTVLGLLAWGNDPNVLYVQGNDGRGTQGIWSIDLKSGGKTLLSSGTFGPLRLNGAATHLYYTQRSEGRHRIIERELSTGTDREVLSYEAGALPASFSLSPDGSKIYYRLPAAGATRSFPQSRIVERNLGSGAERVLSEGRFGVINLSPDGRAIVVPQGDADRQWRAVLVLSTEGEPVSRELPRLAEGVFNFAAWAPDGRSVLLTRPRESDRPSESWWVPLDKRAPKKLAHFVGAPTVHLDGASIAFSLATEEPRRFGLWVMEGFLSTPRVTGQPR
jgi:Tol biopolymer transport system component